MPTLTFDEIVLPNQQDEFDEIIPPASPKQWDEIITPQSEGLPDIGSPQWQVLHQSTNAGGAPPTSQPLGQPTSQPLGQGPTLREALDENGPIGGVMEYLSAHFGLTTDEAKSLIGPAFAEARIVSKLVGHQDYERGLESGAVETLQSLTQPENALLLAMKDNPATRVAFASQMLADVPQSVRTLHDSIKSGDMENAGRATVALVANSLLGGSLLKEPLGPRPAAEVATPSRQPTALAKPMADFDEIILPKADEESSIPQSALPPNESATTRPLESSRDVLPLAIEGGETSTAEPAAGAETVSRSELQTPVNAPEVQTTGTIPEPPELAQARGAIMEREQMLAQEHDPGERRAITNEIVDLRGQIDQLERAHDQANAIENAWSVVSPATRDRLMFELRSRGVPEDELASLTPQQARTRLDDLAKPQSTEPIASRTQRELSEEEIAVREYEQELMQQSEAEQAAQGRELIDAVRRAGGLPSKTASAREAFSGELADLEDLAQTTGQKSIGLFRTDAPGLDQLATLLRDRGFPVEGPNDVLDLLDQRFRTGRNIYGNPGLTRALAEGAGVMETPSVGPKEIARFVDKQQISPDKKTEAADGIARTISLNADPGLARLYEEAPRRLRNAQRAGVAAVPAPELSGLAQRAETSRAGFSALQSGRSAEVIQALRANRNRLSIVIPELVRGERAGFDIKGTVLAAPVDMAMAVQTIRSPWKESLKVAAVDPKTSHVLDSEIVHVGTLNESLVHARDIMRIFANLRDKFPDAELVLSHNHPSGDPSPSQADWNVHRRMEEAARAAGTKIRDHVITNGEKFYSFAANKFGDLPKPVSQPWEVIRQRSMPKLDRPDALAQFAGTLRAEDRNAAHIFYLGTKYNVIGLERIPNGRNLLQLQRAMLNGVAREGAYTVVLDLPGRPGEISNRQTIERLSNAATPYGIRILDATWPGVQSAFEAGLLRESRRSADMIAEEPEKHAMGAAPIKPRQPMLTAPAPGAPAVKAAAGPVRSWWSGKTLGFRKIFAPQTIDKPARMVANIIRDYNGQMANKLAQADHALAEARKDFDRTPVSRGWKYDPAQPLPRNYAFIDNAEHGGANLSPEDRLLKMQLDQMFSDAVDEVRRIAPSKLQSLIQDYFPHIWENPDQAKRIFAETLSKGPLEGPKSFLKKRVLEYTIDGLKAGLRPISDNPIDMALTKLHEIHRFVAAQDMLADAKTIGARKFVYVFEKPPEGWVKVDDPSSTVHGPPFVTVPEAFDEQMRAKTVELLQKLGVPNDRLASLGGQRWGEAEKSGAPPGRIRTRFAGPMSVYWHELGHVLQYRYGWVDQIAHDAKAANLSGNSAIEKQFRALADLRRPQTSTPTKSFEKYVRTKDEKAAVMLEAYLHAPDRMQTVAPNIYTRVKKFITQHPELHDIEEIRPGLALGTMKQQIPLGGMVTLGHYYMPEGAAQVFKNYLSPGPKTILGLIPIRSLRQLTHILSGLQLGFSAFHAGFTSIDAIVSQFALGLSYLTEGKLDKAMSRIATAPFAPAMNYYVGKAVQTAMLNPKWAGRVKILGVERQLSPHGEAVVNDVAKLAVQSGLRATIDPFWKTQITRNMLRAFREGAVRGYGGAVTRVPFTISEQLMRPILEFLVPRQKLGVFAGIAQQGLERLGSNADIQAVREMLARAADSTEDRMGQMTYDNLFYNRVARDAALLGFRAYGWTYGKYRAFFGGIADTFQTLGRMKEGGPLLTPRMAYLVALPMTVAGIGSVMNYLMTGQPPQDWRDMIMPRTGRLDRNGNPQRLSLPTYVKDLLSDWHDVLSGRPLKALQSFSHKLNPWYSIAQDLIYNADFFGTRIYDPDDPVLKKLWDVAKFTVKSAAPFSVTSHQRLLESRPTFAQQILPYFGFVPAKAELTMTPAQARAAELFQATLPRGARTPDQAEHSRLFTELLRDMKEADPTWQANLGRALQAGRLQLGDVANLRRALPLNPLQYQVKKLSAQDAMKVWDLASPTERAQLLPILMSKVLKSHSLSPEQRAQFLNVLKQRK